MNAWYKSCARISGSSFWAFTVWIASSQMSRILSGNAFWRSVTSHELTIWSLCAIDTRHHFVTQYSDMHHITRWRFGWWMVTSTYKKHKFNRLSQKVDSLIFLRKSEEACQWLLLFHPFSASNSMLARPFDLKSPSLPHFSHGQCEQYYIAQ